MEQPFCVVYAEIKHPDFTTGYTRAKGARYVQINFFDVIPNLIYYITKPSFIDLILN